MSEKKPLKIYVEKGTYELAFKKQKVNTTLRKVLNQFEVQSTRTKEWFKFDIEFFKPFSKKSFRNL